MDLLDPLVPAFWIRVGTAIVCGGLVGLERQLRGKPAGMRTSILICLGTHFFVLLGSGSLPPHADPTRVLGQVVTGIGFLGAGVILTREGLVVGVTSAAVIWLLAAVGAMIGLGHLSAAAAVSLTNGRHPGRRGVPREDLPRAPARSARATQHAVPARRRVRLTPQRSGAMWGGL